MEKEILRLFKGYLGEKTDDINELGLKYGLLIPKTASDTVVEEAIKQYGKDGITWNQTFHKSFDKVKNASMEELIVEQAIHYITTYGFEELGIYNSESVYIPRENLEIPELDNDIELIVVSPLTNDELSDKIMTLLTSGIALSKQSVNDIMVLSDFVDKERFDEISNREIKIALYDKYDIVPKNPEEFLRYMIFKLTGETLKIQNRNMIEKLERSDKYVAHKLLKSYLDYPFGYKKLSSIFLRNKNLFLALKINKDEDYIPTIRKWINHNINVLRKQAKNNHQPLEKNILDCLTDDSHYFEIDDVLKKLDDVTIFREIRILNGILYRLLGNDSIIYKIRNGSAYTKTLKPRTVDYVKYLYPMSEAIRKHLVERLKEKVDDKKIFIPYNVVYAAPTSEKQFNGNIPEGSYIEVPRQSGLVYGVHWKNIDRGGREERVDLDLKQMNKSQVFGWDASYRSDNSSVLFSGDITDAILPDGATELFYVDKNYGNGAFLVTLNMYTCNSDDVPFEFVIAKAENNGEFNRRYVLNPNDIIEKINMNISNKQRQMVVGFITISDNVRFYFNDFSAGSNIGYSMGYSSSQRDEITMGAFDYLKSYSKIQLKLNDLLKDAGATIMDSKTYYVLEKKVNEDGTTEDVSIEKEVDIDLSPNAITKESIIKLLS